MITIGVTGGVGAGKSVVMDYLKKEYNAAVIKADEAARLLEEPGQDCYNELLDIFGKSILDENGYIDKKAFAAKIFSDPEARAKTNACVHPAVKKRRVIIIDHDNWLPPIMLVKHSAEVEKGRRERNLVCFFVDYFVVKIFFVIAELIRSRQNSMSSVLTL